MINLVTDSSIKPKSKSITSDISDMERNNVYQSTPPKMKSNTMIPVYSQRCPPVPPIRSDSTRSVGNNRSNDAGVITQMKNFIPLQSVKEDECLDNEKSSKVNH